MTNNTEFFCNTIKVKEHDNDPTITENGYSANIGKYQYITFFVNNSQEGLSSELTVRIKEENRTDTYNINLNKIDFRQPIPKEYNIKFNSQLQEEIKYHLESINIYDPELSYYYTLAYYIISALTISREISWNISRELVEPLLADFNTVSETVQWSIIDSIINLVEKHNAKKKQEDIVKDKIQELEEFVKNNF